MGKGAISPFPSVFNLFEKLSSIFIKFEIAVCKFFHFGRVQNLSFGKGLMNWSPQKISDNLLAPLQQQNTSISIMINKPIKTAKTMATMTPVSSPESSVLAPILTETKKTHKVFGPWRTFLSTLYLICQFKAFQIQQQIKIWCQKYRQMGIQLSDWVENVGNEEIARYEQFLLFP